MICEFGNIHYSGVPSVFSFYYTTEKYTCNHASLIMHKNEQDGCHVSGCWSKTNIQYSTSQGYRCIMVQYQRWPVSVAVALC